ncbi:type IX secretion system sortase PorU [Prevotella sp. S7 MS 2]|uniref:type IX secretion system sortase PorU n=1 Tax=Prevotella sp. S7 MS 2 TaxID=1287488 RepID=UPI000691ABEF|nr:type IX secretion system sortase PorU [Prevotella sp. S7 MS 2]
MKLYIYIRRKHLSFVRRVGAVLLFFLCSLPLFSASRFFNLIYEQVKIDSVLPRFSFTIPIGTDYADSTYQVSILYPEYMNMTSTDIAQYKKISDMALPASPVIEQHISVNRKNGELIVNFLPLVYRDNRYQVLVSFMLRIESKRVSTAKQSSRMVMRAPQFPAYTASSVLSTGTWAKIRVAETGVYELTDALIRKAGFTDISKVKVYGYGGALQPEAIKTDYIRQTDDLHEVPLTIVGGRRLFHAVGPVTWSRKDATRRTRNPYSSYGYYFITQTDAVTTTKDSTAFLQSFYPSTDDYHSLYEVDGYSWYHGGRNLFDTEAIPVGSTKKLVLKNEANSAYGTLSVNVSAGIRSQVQIAVNEQVKGIINVSLVDYDKGSEAAGTYVLNSLTGKDVISITTLSGGPVRLDYVSMAWAAPKPAPRLASQTFKVPEYVGKVANQNLHADEQYDMVMIIPASKKLKAQAERLKTFHELHDGLRVRIVPANELYNEFSSGTPDVNAYRRYLKMLYDRAKTSKDAPRYLLLFGDCVWDNRMLTPECRNLKADDYLLCYESENSFNEITCYVDDGFVTLLDEDEGGNPKEHDQQDVAVGRFPVTTAAEAKVMVDKTINYMENKNGGSWLNTLMFMGDDGNQNLHMDDANDAADWVRTNHPGYLVRKVLWDAYTRETSSIGNTYPEATKLIKQQQAAGALIMDYAGHGSETLISHESVLRLTDFASFTNKNLPLWITASCNIMPFDGVTENIGEATILNPNGGAVAFFGTTRTVYAQYNKRINMAYLRYVLGKQDGKPVSIGEAQRLAKNYLITSGQDLTTNKLQYSLLGDPALVLHQPSFTAKIDAINGVAASSDNALMLKAGSTVKITGHIENAPDFTGTLTATVRDSEELITCKRNDESEADEAFTYYDRTKTLFNGTDSVKNGKFSFSFAVPKDINYSNESGLINLFAISNAKSSLAHGYNNSFKVGGSAVAKTDSVGPSIYCYLNTSSFSNGGKVNSTPYFVAEITDKDGINVTGNGIGHDLELVIDDDMSKTYVLNNNFSYDFGSFTKGSTYYNIPTLSPGKHTLTFRAWDTLNNSSVSTLTFNVVEGLNPNIFDVSVNKNPASSTTTFIVNHDRAGSNIDVTIEVYDLSGRILWRNLEKGITPQGAYTLNWDLTTAAGTRLQTGVYLFRATLGSDGGVTSSKAKKLIVVGNN